MINRIALGTVQFGLDYGVTNKSGIPSDDALKEIFAMAQSNGVLKLDTASGYGNAEERIGKLGENRFDIITKVNGVKSVSDLNASVNTSLNNLKQDSIYGLMFHDADEILESCDLWSGLEEIKSKGTIRKIGYSLYNPQQLDDLLALNMIPDIVQVPFNILDRRFEDRFRLLKARNVEIHVRSAFLQGLLLSKEVRSSSYFSQWSNTWETLDQWMSNQDLSPLEACIGHVQSYQEIDHLVVGVSRPSEFSEVLAVSSELVSGRRAPKSLSSEDSRLINPSNWNKIPR